MWEIKIEVQNQSAGRIDNLETERPDDALDDGIERGIAWLRTFAPHSSDLGPLDQCAPPFEGAWKAAAEAQRAVAPARVMPPRGALLPSGLLPSELVELRAAGIDEHDNVAVLEWLTARGVNAAWRAEVQQGGRRQQAHKTHEKARTVIAATIDRETPLDDRSCLALAAAIMRDLAAEGLL